MGSNPTGRTSGEDASETGRSAFPGSNLKEPKVTDQEIAEPNEILRSVVGSTVHGLAIEGTDDHDEMGVCIPPPDYVIGLRKFEQWTWRTQPEGVRSGPGDTDLTVYSLQKYMRLAMQGNPSVLIPLFAPEDALIVTTELGFTLRDLAPAIISKQAGYRFLGYMQAQKARMLGEGRQSRMPKRPELVEKYGFDTKYAGHVIRLGYQGVELLSTGKLTLPMIEQYQEIILNIRQGKYNQETVLKQAEYLEHRLEGAIDGTHLPDRPDYDKINRELLYMHQEHWKGKGLI